MKFKYISWLPAVLIMIIIFSFSSKQAVSSEENSLPIANGILHVYESITNHQFHEDARMDTLYFIDHIVRKCAHFTEYLLLAISLGLNFAAWKFKGWKLFLSSFAVAVLYAASDEFHQLYIQGRSGQVKDVFIDSSGAFVGILLFLLLQSLVVRRRKRKNLSELPR